MTKDKLKLKLRDLDRRITKIDRTIFVADRLCKPQYVVNRAALDQRRREVRRELKARPEGSGPGFRKVKWQCP